MKIKFLDPVCVISRLNSRFNGNLLFNRKFGTASSAVTTKAGVIMSNPQSPSKPSSDLPCPEIVVKLTRLSPKDDKKHTRGKTDQISTHVKAKKIKFDPHTPKASVELALELKQVINERNILTSKTRKRVFDCLDEIKSNSETERRDFKREKALLEIVNSEIKYVKQLETIIEFFMVPVQDKVLLKQDDYEILFGNIRTIYNINKELLEQLDQGFDHIPQAFNKIAPFLKLYSVYAYGFKNQLKILQNARSCNPAFAKFIENQETRPEVQIKLSALLITPIQRVPRYKLLLNQLLALTTPEDKHFALLKGRTLKKEGILHKMSTKQNTHSEKLYVVLMSDIIMFNKMKKEHLSIGSLKVTSIFPLNKSKVTEILDKGCLKISCQEEELILYHDQLSETTAWISSINQAIQCHLEDRKSLRKESSNRRAVKRKDINEYHEVGLSPGHPLKKRKLAPDEPATVTSKLPLRIAARKSIRSACNSTPIKLQSNPETAHEDASCFPSMEISHFSIDSNWKVNTEKQQLDTLTNSDTTITGCQYSELKPRRDLFVFGRKEQDQNVSKMGSFFKSVGSGIKGFFGFKS
ncbi:protein ECT2 isoform X3 [Dendroctonus ponderosae]|uniref:protein ECT2 isoform X3 n=1 Tax=Dendroctonus ponderosae TaxID=77166 RepID=UPI002034C773|nr:protein ECT2 isoform X3 [Dendroctonus ponderosae]